MKLIAVIGGWDYEGEVFSSLRLFKFLATAEDYKKELSQTYDYVKSSTQAIEEES